MSADNGIYYAKFPDGYRVIHAQTIDNLFFYEPGSKQEQEVIYDYFKDAKVFPSLTAVLQEAQRLANLIDYTEYGIVDLGDLPACIVP